MSITNRLARLECAMKPNRTTPAKPPIDYDAIEAELESIEPGLVAQIEDAVSRYQWEGTPNGE